MHHRIGNDMQEDFQGLGVERGGHRRLTKSSGDAYRTHVLRLHACHAGRMNKGKQKQTAFKIATTESASKWRIFENDCQMKI